MSGESHQQNQKNQNSPQDGTAKDQKQNTGYGDKKLKGPNNPST
jgi:hypothetical protein